MQYQNGSPASPWVTRWLLTGAVALITSNREVRRRSSFGGRALPPPIRVPLVGPRCRWLPRHRPHSLGKHDVIGVRVRDRGRIVPRPTVTTATPSAPSLPPPHRRAPPFAALPSESVASKFGDFEFTGPFLHEVGRNTQVPGTPLGVQTPARPLPLANPGRWYPPAFALRQLSLQQREFPNNNKRRT